MFAGIFYGCGFGGVLRSVSHGREGPWPPSQVSRVLIVTRDHSGNMSHSVHMLLGVFWVLIEYRPIYVSCIASVHSQWPSAFWRWVCSSFKAICATPCAVWPYLSPLLFANPIQYPLPTDIPCIHSTLPHLETHTICHRRFNTSFEFHALSLCSHLPVGLTLKHTCHFVTTPHLETYHIYFLLGSLYPEIKPNKIEMWLLCLFLT